MLVLSALNALSAQAQEPPTRMTLQELKDDDSRQVHSQVIKQVDGQDLVLLSCKPDGWKENDKRTAFVWIHGGGFTGGHPKQFTTHMKYAAASGAVGFGIQYRLMKSPGYKFNKKLSKEENQKLRTEKYQAFMEGPSIQDLIDDCADAIRYIRQHANALGVDPDRIVVAGDSAGAFLVNALGTMVPIDATPNVLIPCSSISDLTVGFGRGIGWLRVDLWPHVFS